MYYYINRTLLRQVKIGAYYAYMNVRRLSKTVFEKLKNKISPVARFVGAHITYTCDYCIILGIGTINIVTYVGVGRVSGHRGNKWVRIQFISAHPRASAFGRTDSFSVAYYAGVE